MTHGPGGQREAQATPAGAARQGQVTAGKSAVTGERGNTLSQASGQTQDLSWLLTDFTERVPAVVHAAVVSSDGVPLAASDGIPPDRLEQLSAITSGLVSLARGAASMFDGGAVSQALVTMAQGILVIAAISGGASLAVLSVIDADLDLVAYEMTVLAEQAGGVLTPGARRLPEEAETPA